MSDRHEIERKDNTLLLIVIILVLFWCVVVSSVILSHSADAADVIIRDESGKHIVTLFQRGEGYIIKDRSGRRVGTLDLNNTGGYDVRTRSGKKIGEVSGRYNRYSAPRRSFLNTPAWSLD